MKKRVAKAAKFLDFYEPGWHNQIDLTTLAMPSHRKCVLGQLYGSYFGAPPVFHLYRHAFIAVTLHGFRKQEKFWTLEIIARRGREHQRTPDTFPAEWAHEHVRA